MSKKRSGDPRFVDYVPPADGRVPLGPDGLPDLPLPDYLIEAARVSLQHRDVLSLTNNVVRSIHVPFAPTPPTTITVDVALRPTTPDGPTEDGAFWFRGKAVKLKLGTKQLRLLLALWDREQGRPRTPREVQDVIDEVWDHDNETSQEAFRRLYSEVNGKLEADEVPLRITAPGGRIWLEDVSGL